MKQVLHGHIVHAPKLGALEIIENGYMLLEDGKIVSLSQDVPEGNVAIDNMWTTSSASRASHKYSSNGGSGSFRNRTWMDGSGETGQSWTMKVNRTNRNYLMLLYWGDENDVRNFNIMCDDVLVASESLCHNDPGFQRHCPAGLVIRARRYMRSHGAYRIAIGCALLDLQPLNGVRVVGAPDLRAVIQHTRVRPSAASEDQWHEGRHHQVAQCPDVGCRGHP